MWLHVSSNQIMELLLPGTRPWWTVKGRRRSGDGFLNKLIYWVRRRRHHLCSNGYSGLPSASNREVDYYFSQTILFSSLLTDS
jgi:hypothetical protein